MDTTVLWSCPLALLTCGSLCLTIAGILTLLLDIVLNCVINLPQMDSHTSPESCSIWGTKQEYTVDGTPVHWRASYTPIHTVTHTNGQCVYLLAYFFFVGGKGWLENPEEMFTCTPLNESGAE